MNNKTIEINPEINKRNSKAIEKLHELGLNDDEINQQLKGIEQVFTAFPINYLQKRKEQDIKNAIQDIQDNERRIKNEKERIG